MIRAKKSLGQNFLKSGVILDQIVGAGEISEGDFVLEIGPGKGSLTEKLLQKGAWVLAIEKDARLIELLKEKFQKEIDAGQLKIIEADILNFDIEENIKEKYKLVANIPYYITGQIMEKFLSAQNQPTAVVLMIQKEVADRIMAREGKESILSVSVKAYCQPKYVAKVPAKFFSPQPKVDSAIIKLQNISKKLFTENSIEEKKFFDLVRTGFSHKRKILLSNIKTGDKNYEERFKKCELDPKVRAEKLSPEDWVCLIK